MPSSSSLVLAPKPERAARGPPDDRFHILGGRRLAIGLPRQQPSRRARRTTGSPRLSGSHAAGGRRHPPGYCSCLRRRLPLRPERSSRVGRPRDCNARKGAARKWRPGAAPALSLLRRRLSASTRPVGHGKQSPARRRTERSENETIRSRRSELGGGERPDRSSPVGDWSTLGSQGAPISSVIPLRRQTWGAARFRRGLEAPAPTGQATRSARRPRRAPGSSRRQRTGPPSRPRGTSANGGGKAMPPSHGSWRSGSIERFASWFRSRKRFRWVRLRRCRCRRVLDTAANGGIASPLLRAWRGLRVPRPRERAPTRLRPARRSHQRVSSNSPTVTSASAPASAGARRLG